MSTGNPTTPTNPPDADYPLPERYNNLVRGNPRSEAFYRNVEAHDFYLWANLVLVECPHCFESVVLNSALVHLRLAHHITT